VLHALDELPRRGGILFPASGGGRINIDNFRAREWMPAHRAAGIAPRRIYDMRHTFATWSLAAGMNIFTLARRMGTSLQMIDMTYGHLAQDAEDQDHALLDAYDSQTARLGTLWARTSMPRLSATMPEHKNPA
jgi:integrase